MKPFIVFIQAPAGFPLIGDIAQVEVQANNPRHASMVAEAMRDRMGWPRGCVYRARLKDTRSYVVNVVDSALGALA